MTTPKRIGPHTKWSDEEIDALRNLCKTHSSKEIGEILGRSHTAVQSKVRDMDISLVKTDTTKDLKGNKYGLLTAIEFVEVRNGRAYWLCECECGAKVVKCAKRLKSGQTSTCGDKSKHPLKHGQYKSRLFAIWRGMKYRCNNPNLNTYSNYGGRGIKVCQEWMESFESFWKWALNNGYADNLTIDRKDPNGNYEPGNCRWITNELQQNNKRGNRFIEINGISKTVSQWCKEYNITRYELISKIKRGWTGEKLLTPSGKAVING